MALKIYVVFSGTTIGSIVLHAAFVTEQEVFDYVAAQKGHIPHELFYESVML